MPTEEKTEISSPSLDASPKRSKGRPKQGIQRNFSKEVIIHHDAFRLDAAKMQKNMSWIKEQPKYEEFDHCHIFHSYDSNGQKQFYSTPVGGHFHKMEFVEMDNGNIEAKCVSGPLKWAVVWDDEKEAKIRKPVPVNPRDNHTHTVTYLHSEQLKKRKRNVEAGKLLAGQAMLGSKPQGVEVS